MIYLRKEVIVVLLVLLGVVGLFGFVGANNQVNVRADILATDTYLEIEVTPNNISFGTISRGESSQPKKVCVNNTGSSDVLVTPRLPNNYSGIFFDYIYVKKYGSSDSTYKSIGQFDVLITKANPNPEQQCIWFKLDLTNYTDPIYQDFIGHTADIKISAVSQ